MFELHLPSSDTRQLLEKTAQEYVNQRERSQEASEYLERRGFTEGVLDSFRIGYVSDPLPGDQWFEGCVSIPYTTPSGVVGLKYRATDDTTPKYRKVAGFQNLIYNVSVLRRARYVVVTEGELDAVSAAVAGFDAVAIPGAENWKQPWARIFRNRKVMVLCDGDDPGRKFGDMIASKIDDCRVLWMPDGMDVNSVLVAEGPEGLAARLKGKKNG